MSALMKTDPEIAQSIFREEEREKNKIILIASENYTSQAVLEAQGSIFSNKYAEGYPAKRFYEGCEFVDQAESLAIERAKALFKAEHCNVQPLSGTIANLAVYLSVLKPGDRILGMNLSHGGHLSHGASASFTGRIFESFHYGVSRDTHLIDYDEVRDMAKKLSPRIIVTGASSYSRTIDFKRFRDIADETGALLMADIAHIAGLIAADAHPSPVPYADFVTTTTHKTLRGPRGAFILCKKDYASKIDSAVFPGLQGGPFMNIIAAKAVCFREAQNGQFKQYGQQIVKNAKALCDALKERGYEIVTGTTDNHLFLVDLTSRGLTGRDAARALDKAGITLNKNVIPFDTQSPYVTSGIRIGTPIVTTRGMKEDEMRTIAGWIDLILSKPSDETLQKKTAAEVREFCRAYPIWPVISSGE
ncbi:MAG: aminotransferase class I/II-fold pyridoxal phosphate-dependent enzyme [Nitrospiraceae bacterium]|nr:aminotransferase class I/II-fold pyridoxal phosphate-dependent enzyme [Nitrospiraceae bacterium]